MNTIIDDFTKEEEIKQDSEFWDYQNDVSIIGIVTEINDGIYGTEITLDIGGEHRKKIPSLTVLKTKLAGVEILDKVKIVCLGKVKNYYDFRVWIKKNTDIELEK